MASGDTLAVFMAQAGVPTGTIYATQDAITGASTPAEAVPVLDFDSATQEYIDFYGWMPARYGAGGITVTVIWSSDAATGNAIWAAALRAIPDDAEDLDTTAFTYDYNTVTAAAPSAVGETSQDNITFTDGADMDSVPASSHFILRVSRDSDAAGDTIDASDCNLHLVVIKET